MEIRVSPDFSQSMIKKILGDTEIDTYMDGVDIWSKGSSDDHMLIVNKVIESI